MMHYLCHALNIAGHEAYVALCDVVNPQLRTPFLTNAIRAQHKQAGRVPITVYPEVIDGNPLASSVVVRYILNREGFLSGRDVAAADSDLFFYYAEDFRDSSSEGNMLTLPIIDSQLFCPPTEPVERKQSYLYLHRYPIEKIDFSLLPDDIELLTFKNAKTLAELAEIFKRAHVLYSFEVSTICTEAMLCGCPVIYFEGDHIQSLPFTSYIGDSGAALYHEPGGWERARASVWKVREVWLEMEVAFWGQFEQFIELTQEAAANFQQTLQPSIQDWMKQRVLSPAQARLVSQHQASLDQHPGVLVIVLDPKGQPQALSTTLASVDLWQAQTQNRLTQIVYSASPYPADLSFGTQWENHTHDLAKRLNDTIQDSDADWFIV
ncbi:MAG TPA: hypothetical protein VGC62_23210, partial [Pseudomonas sp.]